MATSSGERVEISGGLSEFRVLEPQGSKLTKKTSMCVNAILYSSSGSALYYFTIFRCGLLDVQLGCKW